MKKVLHHRLLFLCLLWLAGWAAAPVWAAGGGTAPTATLKKLLNDALEASKQGDSPTAAALTQQAWDLARRQHNRRWEWEAINYLVDVAQTSHQLPQALGYARQALAVAQALGNDTLITKSCTSMGATLGESGQYREADIYMQRALAGVRRQHKYLHASHVLVNLAWNATDLKNLPKARAYADEAVAIARQQANATALCNALEARANIAAMQGQKVAAVADIEEALRAAQTSGRLKNILYVRSSMAEIYEQAGRLPEALAAQRRYTALNDSLNSAEVRLRMGELSTRFGVQQQQDSILTLKQEQRIVALNAAQAQARARLWSFAALALAGLLAVGGWLLRQVRRSRAELAVSEAGLRAANATQSQLMRIIGHDLRAPLASFQQVEPVLLALAHTPNAPQQVQLATALGQRARAVSSLVDNLLDWSRVQTGQVAAFPQPVRLAGLAQGLQRIFAPVAAAKNVQLLTDLPDDLPETFSTDPNLLGAILRNLLANALKFTPEGGTVRLALAATDAGGVAISVADTGLGMPPEKLAAALGGGAVGSTPGTAHESGTGLGLAVCHHFVGLLGAVWTGESEPGKGMRWELRLPG